MDNFGEASSGKGMPPPPIKPIFKAKASVKAFPVKKERSAVPEYCSSRDITIPMGENKKLENCISDKEEAVTESQKQMETKSGSSKESEMKGEKEKRKAVSDVKVQGKVKRKVKEVKQRKEVPSFSVNLIESYKHMTCQEDLKLVPLRSEVFETETVEDTDFEIQVLNFFLKLQESIRKHYFAED